MSGLSRSWAFYFTIFVFCNPCMATGSSNWHANANDLLTKSMNWMDTFYDPSAGYMFNVVEGALTHETRSSSWYAAGLLARNEGNDRIQAARIIRNIIGGQNHNASAQWYGDYQVYPEQPTVGIPAYPPVIYNSWDPNWRGFIGTTFIVILEEFSHLLEDDLKALMLQSLHLDAKGDTYRVGGVDDDNLYPSYSNAAIMHTALSGWVGRHTNDSNLTAEGERWGHEIVNLFDIGNALSEFNSPTYAGVSLWGLAIWAKYLPSDSVLGQNGGRLITAVWETTAQLYNANLRNMAGPWDRSYGYDMNRYLSIMGLWIWNALGHEASPIYKYPQVMAHEDDFEFGPLVSVLGPCMNSFISETAMSSLRSFPGTHTFNTTVFSPAYDKVPRNISASLSPYLTIGAESFDENVVGGPNINQQQFNPAVIQWLRSDRSDAAIYDGRVGFISLYAEAEALQATVKAGELELTYPYGNCSSQFTFLVAPNPLCTSKDIYSWDDVTGINVKVSGSVNKEPVISFCGLVGGTCEPNYDFEFWNFTYSMPSDCTAKPNIKLSIELS